MLVTIVTPSYNQGRYIETTIQSVVTQSHAEIEYIVVDGFSVDRTIEVLRKYEAHPRVSKIIVERDKGQADAINKGFRMARGEIVGWINSDDCLVPDTVKRTVEAFATEPNLGITYGDIACVDHDLKIKGYSKGVWSLSKEYLVNINYYIQQPGSFYRRSAVEKIGFLDENLRYCMDLDLWLKILEYFPAKHLGCITGYFRLHANTKTSGEPLPFLHETAKVLNKHGARPFAKSKRKLYMVMAKIAIKSLISKLHLSA